MDELGLIQADLEFIAIRLKHLQQDQHISDAAKVGALLSSVKRLAELHSQTIDALEARLDRLEARVPAKRQYEYVGDAGEVA